jgi:hypothetical protein
MTAGCDEVRWVERLLVRGDLTSRRMDRLRAHVATCAQCRALYDRAIALRRHLEGGVPLAAAQVEGIARRVLPAPRRSLAWRWVPAAAAVAAAGVAAIVLSVRSADIPPEAPAAAAGQGRFSARSAGAAPFEGVRAFCVVAGRASPIPAGGSCPRDGLLQFTYSNRRARYLFLFGIDASGRALWYFPAPPETESVAIRGGAAGEVAAVDEPLPGSTRLAVNHRPGVVRVLALFTDRPLRVAEVAGRIPPLAGGAAPEAVFAPLGEGESVTPLTFEVVP